MILSGRHDSPFIAEALEKAGAEERPLAAVAAAAVVAEAAAAAEAVAAAAAVGVARRRRQPLRPGSSLGADYVDQEELLLLKKNQKIPSVDA